MLSGRFNVNNAKHDYQYKRLKTNQLAISTKIMILKKFYEFYVIHMILLLRRIVYGSYVLTYGPVKCFGNIWAFAYQYVKTRYND